MNTLTAERITAAADYLAKHAARATPGPWYATGKSHGYGGIVGPATPATDPLEVEGYGGELIAETVRGGNGQYLQIVRPHFGTVVANWLHLVANGWHEQFVNDVDHAAILKVIQAIEGAASAPFLHDAKAITATA